MDWPITGTKQNFFSSCKPNSSVVIIIVFNVTKEFKENFRIGADMSGNVCDSLNTTETGCYIVADFTPTQNCRIVKCK